MSLGTTIYKNRKQKHLSQSQLADQLHVSRQAISNWENDRFFPSMDNIFELSTIFDIPVANLLEDNTSLKEDFKKQQAIKDAKFFK